jgi:hypothetical protein
MSFQFFQKKKNNERSYVLLLFFTGHRAISRNYSIGILLLVFFIVDDNTPSK